jgi:rubrerythrin
MAEAILDAALLTEYNAASFYKKVLSSTHDDSLIEVYHLLADFEDDHVCRIKNRIAQYQAEKNEPVSEIGVASTNICGIRLRDG